MVEIPISYELVRSFDILNGNAANKLVNSQVVGIKS